MKNILFLYVFFAFNSFLFSQINESDSLKVKASLSITGFWQSGNVDTFIFRTKTDFSYKFFEKWVYKNQNSYVYQEFGKTKADADILSLNFLYFNTEKKLYPQILGFFSTNFRRQIDYRYLLGGGVTYQILNDKKKENWLKTSLTFEYEGTQFGNTQFNIEDYNGLSEIDTFRGTIWISGKYNLFKKKVIITHQSYYQPSLSEGNNYRWQADLGVELPIWKFLNFKINYLHTFESIVIAGQDREDQFLTFGLTLKNF